MSSRVAVTPRSAFVLGKQAPSSLKSPTLPPISAYSPRLSQVSEGHWDSDMLIVPVQAHLSSLCLQPPPSAQHSQSSQSARQKEEEEQTPACAERVGPRGKGLLQLNQVTGHRKEAVINPGRKSSETEFLLLLVLDQKGPGRLQAG